jgi:integrase
MTNPKTKRGAKGGGTIRRFNETTWQGRVTLGLDPGTGKQKQKSIYGKTKAEVQRKMNEALHQVDEGIYTEPSRLTVGKWMDIWLDEYTGGIKEQSRDQYRSVIKVHILPALGNVKLVSLKPHMIQAFYNSLVREEKKNPKTVKNVHGVLRKALQQAVKLQYIPANPCQAVQLPKVQKKDIRPLTEAQVKDFLQVIRGSEYEDILKVDLFTGMRQGEIMGLTWDRIDFKAGTILIDRQMVIDRNNSYGYAFATTKTDRARKIKPAPFVMDILKARKDRQRFERETAGNQWNEGDFKGAGLVFTTALGAHYGKSTLYKNTVRFGEMIGVEGLRFHDLRHTYAVLSIRAGDDIKTISSNLGHSTITMTMDTYAHFTEDMANDSAARMEAYSARFGAI